ncbi:MAG: hypothetical protein RDV41_05680 [Planctomycetota bacterium]|nr:hypothetical protein [Planctomycetota bacterium]
MKKILRILFHARLFTPKGLLVRAAVIAVVFLVLHVCGLREYTSIISGMSPTGDTADSRAITLGVMYGCFYFAFVLVAPILVLAAVFFGAVEYVGHRELTHGPEARPPHPTESQPRRSEPQQ